MENYILERQYFELRKEQENALLEFKSKQNKERKLLIKDLNKLKGVSKQRVDHAITLMKKMTLLSLEKQTDDTYNLILSNLERSFIRHYEENYRSIKFYINRIFGMQRDLALFRKNKKKKFNEFKKILSDNNIDAGILNKAYLEYKNAIKYISNEDITLDEYNNRMSKYQYINSIVDDFISYECERLQEKRNDKIKLEQQEFLYLQAINDMFGTPKKSSTDELVESIICEMLNSGEISLWTNIV